MLLMIAPVLYLSQVIVMGAEQNGLPMDYQEKLKAIETNKYEGPLPVMEELDRVLRTSKISPTQSLPSLAKS